MLHNSFEPTMVVQSWKHSEWVIQVKMIQRREISLDYTAHRVSVIGPNRTFWKMFASLTECCGWIIHIWGFLDLVWLNFTLKAGHVAGAVQVVLVADIHWDFISAQRNWELSGSCSKMCSLSQSLSLCLSLSLSYCLLHMHTHRVRHLPHILLYSL